MADKGCLNFPRNKTFLLKGNKTFQVGNKTFKVEIFNFGALIFSALSFSALWRNISALSFCVFHTLDSALRPRVVNVCITAKFQGPSFMVWVILQV